MTRHESTATAWAGDPVSHREPESGSDHTPEAAALPHAPVLVAGLVTRGVQ